MGIFFMAALEFSACKKNIEPLVADAQNAYINFYNASEILTSNPNLSVGNMVYVNDSIPQYPFMRYPEFSSGNPQYPRNTGGGLETPPGNVNIPSGIGYSVAFWMPIAPGQYKFIFTSVNKNYLKDIALTLAAKDRTALYLVESPDGNDQYRLVAVPTERAGTPGKVRIKVVNLSPDAGTLGVVRDNNGTTEVQGLPQHLQFGEYSEYVEIEPNGTSATSFIDLEINKADGNQNLISTSIPAIPGSSFVLLIQGFTTVSSRKIITGKQTDGSPIWETVNVPANFRATWRRTF